MSTEGIKWAALQMAWDEVDAATYAVPSVDFLPNDVAVVGKCVLQYKVDKNSWTGIPSGLRKGSLEGESYWSPVLDNPTWLDVLVQFDHGIPMVQDFHHVFLEGLEPTGLQQDGVPIYEFCTGS